MDAKGLIDKHDWQEPQENPAAALDVARSQVAYLRDELARVQEDLRVATVLNRGLQKEIQTLRTAAAVSRELALMDFVDPPRRVWAGWEPLLVCVAAVVGALAVYGGGVLWGV